LEVNIALVTRANGVVVESKVELGKREGGRGERYLGVERVKQNGKLLLYKSAQALPGSRSECKGHHLRKKMKFGHLTKESQKSY
jgi:hypothetical protein